MNYPSGFDLGPGPEPQSSEQWRARLAPIVGELFPDLGLSEQGEPPRIDVQCSAEGVVASVGVDLTHVEISGAEHRRTRTTPTASRYAPMPPGTSERRVVDRIDVRGDPVVVEGVPVRVNVLAREVSVTMRTDERGHLWLAGDAEGNHAMTAHGDLCAGMAEVQAAAGRLLEPELARMGLKLASLDLQMHTPQPRRIQVEATARVRKGILGAPVHVQAQVDIDDAMTARISRVGVTSRNPVVAAVLATVAGRVERFEGREVDLNGYLPDPLRLTDLQVNAGEDLKASFRLG